MLGRVYKIVDSQSDDVYVGSTFRELSVRFGKHTAGSPTAIGKLMKEHGRSRYSIILIREYQVADKYQLHAYEQLWINKTKCINKQSAFCIERLYICASKDKANKRSAKYRFANKDKVNAGNRRHNEANKNKIKERREAKRDDIIQKKREYNKVNKDKINQKNREYREVNKKKLNQKFDCECGGKYTWGSKARHMKTKKHLDFESSS